MGKGELQAGKKRKSLDELPKEGLLGLNENIAVDNIGIDVEAQTLKGESKKGKKSKKVKVGGQNGSAVIAEVDLGAKAEGNGQQAELNGQIVSGSVEINGQTEPTEKKEKKKKKKDKKSVKENGDSSERKEGRIGEGGAEAENVEERKTKKKEKKSVKESGESSEMKEEGVVDGGAQAENVGKKKKKKRKPEEVGGGGDKVIRGGDGEELAAKAGDQEGGVRDKKAKNGKGLEVGNGGGSKEKKREVAGAKQSSGLKAPTGGVQGSAPGLQDRFAGMEVQVSGRGSGDPEFAPVKNFADAGLPDTITKGFTGFKQPSPIQAHAWPVLRGGRDFIGIAATGSGKTLAFGVPALLHAMAKRQGGAGQGSGQGSGPLCLMVAPTRELAQQIAEVLEDLGKPSGIQTVCVYGGTSKGPQRTALRKNPAIVVATPGRLLDLMEEGCCSLSKASFVVLDEADRMLDLGFEPAIRAILGDTPKERQTVMLSATWPPAVGQLAAEFVRDPIKVTIGSEDLTANHDVTQIVEVVEDRARDARLDTLLRQYHKSRKNRVLVFVLYKKEAVRVESTLAARGWKAVAVHGDKGQADRTRAVTQFKSGAVPLLIATDVAARGLDIPDVEYVINYSFPLTTEDYVHRIGRTGRAGRKGTAHTFFTHNDRARAGELVNVLREAGQPVPEDLMKFGTAVKKKESKLYGAHFREITADAPKAQKITFADSDDE